MTLEHFVYTDEWIEDEGYAMSLDYLLYKSKLGNVRKIVVVKGQPYYESPGNNNAEVKDTWYPFVMLRGTQPLYTQKLPSTYNQIVFNDLLSHDVQSNYIIKLQKVFLNPHDDVLIPDVHGGRVPTRTTLITSQQLNRTSYKWELLRNVGLTDEERLLCQNPLFRVEKPDAILSDPDQVNDWLIGQGATVAKKLRSSPPLWDGILSAISKVNLLRDQE